MAVEMDDSDLERMDNGLLVPTKKALIAIHDIILESLDEQDERHYGILNDSILDYLCHKLKLHNYKEDKIANSYYIGTEIFFQIACRHPFIDGNKRTAYISSLFFARINLREINRATEGRRVENAGKIIETIAGWGEASDVSSLEKMVFESGMIGKRRRPLHEEDVKGFINRFLRNSIRITVGRNEK
jgi:prophage maintenance system killer protein